MNIERKTISVSELENAWKKGDVQACYKLLTSIPDGIIFKLGNLLFELVPSTIEEKELMQRSIKEKKELGLIEASGESLILTGFNDGIDMDDIAGALHRAVDPEKPAIFSHTHWDRNKHPLPGYAEIGFGDIPLFKMFIEQYPLLECRAVFNNGSTARSVIYKGKFR